MQTQLFAECNHYTRRPSNRQEVHSYTSSVTQIWSGMLYESFGAELNPAHCSVELCLYSSWPMQVYAAAENASAIEAELSYDWAPAADMALTVAPTSLFKATTCRFSCGPLCTREQT